MEINISTLASDIIEASYIYYNKTREKVVKEEEYVSIFEHQRTPAGRELGKKVATAALKQGIRPITKLVETKTYQGPILTYPRSFLDKYFSVK